LAVCLSPVYPDGRVCISILHAPGDDPNGYELASERWSPVHTVSFSCELLTLASENGENTTTFDHVYLVIVMSTQFQANFWKGGSLISHSRTTL